MQPLRRPDVSAVLGIVAAAGAAALLHMSLATPSRGFEVLLSIALVGLVAMLVLVARRPVLALVLVSAIALASPGRGGAVAFPLLASVFGVAGFSSRRVSAAAALAAVLVIGVVLSSNGTVTSPDFHALVPWAIAVGLAVAAGLYFGARRAYVESLRERAAQLERERVLLSVQAVADERVRIARELHDVVAHGVSLMVVQAQALGALEPDERDRAAERIADVGREALAEMHTMLDVLRPQRDGEPELAPAPGVGDVPALIAGARSAGLEVALAVEGEPLALPAAIDLSAYRIVQEALTNVIKHARALRTDVRLRYLPQALELTVTDDGTGAVAGGQSPSGHGILGMRERVALFGGTLETGSRSDGGYEVRAVLPL